MIKKLIAVLGLAMLPITANSQPAFAAWDVTLIEEFDVDNIKLDIRDDGNFYLVNGTVNTSGNAGSAAVGSCFFLIIGDVVCELDVRQYTFTMTIRANLNGTLEIIHDGVTVDEGNLIYRQ